MFWHVKYPQEILARFIVLKLHHISVNRQEVIKMGASKQRLGPTIKGSVAVLEGGNQSLDYLRMVNFS